MTSGSTTEHLLRAYAGPADLASIAALVNDCNGADGIDQFVTAADLAADFEHPGNWDPELDVVLAEEERRVIGYARLEWRQEYEGPHVYFHYGFVHPAWRRRGIGGAILARVQARIRQMAAGHPAGPKYFESFAEDRNPGAAVLLERAGYQVETYGADMVRPDLDDLPDCPLPAGLEVRPVRPDQVRTIIEADVEAFRDHWGAAPPTEADIEAYLATPHLDIGLWRVAWEGDRVVGQVKTFINEEENAAYGRKRGYTEDIATARDWRRRGVASALIVASLHDLKERGMEEAALGVHTENPTGALRVYERLGFRVVRTAAVYRRPLS